MINLKLNDVTAKDLVLLSCGATTLYLVGKRLYMRPQNVQPFIREPIPYLPKFVSDFIQWIDVNCFGIGDILIFIGNVPRKFDWYSDISLKAKRKTWSVHMAFFPPFVQTIDPKNIEFFLGTNFQYFEKGSFVKDILGTLFGEGIFAADGQQWKQQRKIASHAFSQTSLRDFMFGCMTKHSQYVLDLLSQ